MDAPRVSPIRKREWCATVFAMVLPTAVTLVYFIWAAKYDSGVQQVAFSITKTLQFLFPAVWVMVVLRGRRPAWTVRPGKGLLHGGLFGLLVLVAMLALYHGVIKSMPMFQGPAAKISEKIVGLGVDTVWRYAAIGLFYAFFHSLLEEYYWRWFVFRQLDSLTSTATAIFVSSLGFMAHHVVVLSAFFGWTSPLTWLFSLSVAIGGAFWAWLYRYSGTLYGAWLSHALVDATIFLIGYEMARATFS